MKKFGFTLSEVLITLGIIGVIAAITIPQMSMNARNQANASRLASVVADLETAFQNMIMKENAEDLTGTDFWSLTLDVNTEAAATAANSALGKYIKLQGCTNKLSDYYSEAKPFKSITGASIGEYGPPYCMLKNAAVMGWALDADMATFTQAEADNLGLPMTELFNHQLYIDVNGPTPPNTEGRDIFGFYVGSDGSLVPMGSEIFSLFTTKGVSRTTYKWSADKACPKSGSIGDGTSCTARLIENGYKVDY